MKHFLGLTVCLILLAACGNHVATAEKNGLPLPTVTPIDIPHATMSFYDITGATEQELLARMSDFGPNGYEAYTKWYIRWNWPGRGTADCNLRDATVSYDITVTFPRWYPTVDATPELIAKWNRYISALSAHERNHVDNVVAQVPLVAAAIQRATCGTAEAAAQAALEPIRQFDIQYDLNTHHRATQGARFP
jgi:predicted secreted Zn-dependent protease